MLSAALLAGTVSAVVAEPFRITGEPFGLKAVLPAGEVDLSGNRTVTPRDRFGDHVLLELTPDPPGCAAYYVWLDLRRARLSEEFGSCAPMSGGRAVRGGYEITMPASNPEDGDEVFRFDGKRVSSRIVGHTAASAESAVPQWQGKSAHAVLSETAIAQLFRAAVPGKQARNLLRHSVAVGTPATAMTPSGDWLVGAGCAANNCRDDRAVVAFSKDGRRVVIAHINDGKITLHGGRLDDMPPRFQQLLQKF